jgi:hypothetical protein
MRQNLSEAIAQIVINPVSVYLVASILARRPSWWIAGIVIIYAFSRVRGYRLYVILDFFILDPIVSFFLGCLVLRPSLTWACLLVLSFGASILISVTSASARGAESYRAALPLLFPEEESNQFITRLPLEAVAPLLPNSLSDGLRERRPYWDMFPLSLLPHEQVKPLLIYQRHFTGPPYDDVLKAFPNASATSFLILRDDPRDGTRLFDRFKFYHEVAHVTTDGVRSWGDRYTRLGQTIIAYSIAFAFSPISFFAHAFLMLNVWAEYNTVKAYQLRLETQADTQALLGIAVKADIIRIRHLCSLAWRPDPSAPWNPQRDAEAKYRLMGMDVLINNLSAGVRRGMLGTGKRWDVSFIQYPLLGLLFFQGLVCHVSPIVALTSLLFLMIANYIAAVRFDKISSRIYDILTARIRAHEVTEDMAGVMLGATLQGIMEELKGGGVPSGESLSVKVNAALDAWRRKNAQRGGHG